MLIFSKISILTLQLFIEYIIIQGGQRSLKIKQVATQWRILRGFKGFARTPLLAQIIYFHGEFQAILCEIRQTNPPFLSLNPLFRYPATDRASINLKSNKYFYMHLFPTEDIHVLYFPL